MFDRPRAALAVSRRHLRSLRRAACVVIATAAGCTNSLPSPPDGALPVPPSCGAPTEITDGVRVELDPSLANATVPVRCPDGAIYEGFASTPAQAFRYRVREGGNRAVTLSTANDRTAVATDTVIAVFEGDCDANRVAIACFDDTRSQGRFERRASGTVLARGGQNLTFLVGYYGSSSAGNASLEVITRENRAPDITAAESLFLSDRVIVWANATDPDGDADVTTLELAFVGPLGELVRVDGYATQRVDALRVGGGLEATLGVVDVPAEVRAVLVRAVDTAGVTSEASVTAPRTTGAFIGVGAACDGPRGPRICLGELECATSGVGAGTCQASATVTAACTTATPLVLAEGSAGLLEARTTVNIPSGAGFLRYPFEQCPEGDLDGFTPRTQGREQILSVPLPPGRWDLLARSSGPPDIDTILYARTVCGDPESTIGCADDIDYAINDYYSALEVRDLEAPMDGGSVVVVAELWDGPSGTETQSFEVLVRLRPVRAAGEACDASYQRDRCAGTPCRAGRCP